MQKYLTVIFIVLAGLWVMGCASQKQTTLYFSDLDPNLRLLPEKLGIDIALIEYPIIGIATHDNFHKSTAIILMTFEVTKWMVADATLNLKKYAQDHIAKMTMDENIAELIGDTPHDQLTVEQSAAVLNMEKERNEISEDEAAYFLKVGANLGVGVLSLTRAVKELPNLIKTGGAMIFNVGSDFKFMGIPKFWAIGPATKSLKESTGRLNGIKNDAPILLEDIKVLVDAFRMLN